MSEDEQPLDHEGLRELLSHARQMQTAYGVIHSIHGELSIEAISDGIVRSLVELGGVLRAEVALEATFDKLHVKSAAQAGVDDTRGCRQQQLDVTARGEVVGALRVFYGPDQDEQELNELLDYVMPTVCIGVDNAISFLEVLDYRRTLEAKVVERTAQLAEAHEQLARNVDELHEAQHAREKFFGNVSHEIRTPLSLILLAAGDIDARAGKLLDERSHRDLGSINDGARKLVRLVDELLLLAAGQAHKLKLNKEPTDLAVLVDNAFAAWRLAAEAAGLELVQRAPKSLVVSIDPVAIERVVSNLLSNAVKYTPRGGTVEVELVESPEKIRISVLDSGPGIDEELAGRLFGRFERAMGEDRRKAGTGIGLSLVKELVEGHGGSVGAHRRDTRGTEMRVELPASIVLRDGKVAAGARSRMAELAPRIDATIASGTRLVPTKLSEGTILVAEDDPKLAEMIGRLLAENYTVIVALDGLDAFEQIKKHQPNLLVTDVDMPGMNGIELSRKFRELTNDKLAPIIILSAVLDLGTRLAGLEAGAIDYVTKPFDPAELRARVHGQFRMRDMALRLHRAEQMASLGILTAGLAHELRNPANGIYNAITPLKKLLPKDLITPDSGATQLLDVMSACAKQIATLSRQLLSFRSGAGDFEMRPADLPELVSRAVKLADGALQGIEVREHLAIDEPVLCAAPLLVQVLANLVENAGHAAGKGGWIAIDGHVQDGRVMVEVADSGPGVPMPLRERVFEPFFTTKPPGIGTGLGLSVARAIVVRHGGVLEIRDRADRTAFVMEIPISRLDTPRIGV